MVVFCQLPPDVDTDFVFREGLPGPPGRKGEKGDVGLPGEAVNLPPSAMLNKGF